MSDHTSRIAELESQIAAIRAEQEVANKLAKAKVQKVWNFTIAVDDRRFDKILDPSVIMYRLVGTVTNRDEMVAAGHSDRDLAQGSMSYLFNTLSGRFIMAHGGGQVYLGYGFMGGGKDNDWSTDQAFAELEEFVTRNPAGGDVTDIIVDHRNRTGKA